jgi:hypothetical protein
MLFTLDDGLAAIVPLGKVLVDACVPIGIVDGR